MKTLTVFIILMAVVIVWLPACSQKGQEGAQALSEKTGALSPEDQGGSKAGEDIANKYKMLPPSLLAMPEVLLGTVYRDQGKFALSTFRGDYVVEGADMSNMVGLTVKVTGAVREDEGKKIVKVESVEQIP